MVDPKSVTITTCAHTDELAVFVSAPHNIVLCNDCYFEQQDVYGKKGQTLKKAANQHIDQLEQIFLQVKDSVKQCSDMQQSVLNMESLENEVIKKVNKQFD
jgi:Zn ribbon nucleic-acid-binding protein